MLPSRSLRTEVVARLILVIAMPPCVYRTSGSLPRLPTRIALLMPRAMGTVLYEFAVWDPTRPVGGGRMRGQYTGERTGPVRRPGSLRQVGKPRDPRVHGHVAGGTYNPRPPPTPLPMDAQTRTAPSLPQIQALARDDMEAV